MKLSELEVGGNYATRADGRWRDPERVRVLEIGEYQTERVTGRVYRDHRGGSYGPPTDEVTTRGVRVQKVWNEGDLERGEPYWTQANQIACTWADHLRKKEEAKIAKAEYERLRMAREDKLRAGLVSVTDALRERGFGFYANVGGDLCGDRRVQIALTAEQAEALAELIRGGK
jgi:hypothetical protein